MTLNNEVNIVHNRKEKNVKEEAGKKTYYRKQEAQKIANDFTLEVM